MVVRGHAVHHAQVHGLAQQPAQDHGVSNVIDVHFIKADQPVPAGEARGERGQRIFRSLQVLQFAMDVAHEVMEVHAAFSIQREGQIKAVHEETFSAPH